DALRAHLLDASIDVVLLHLEVRYAVTQQAANTIVLFQHDHFVPRARELLRACQSRGPGADNRYPFSGATSSGLRKHPALFPAFIDDEVLDRFDADRIIVDVERARSLARRRAQAPGKFRKVVGRM